MLSVLSVSFTLGGVSLLPRPHHHNRLLPYGLVFGIWLLLTIPLLGLSQPTHVQSAVPALLQPLPARFINEQGVPLAQATLRILCYVESGGHFTQTHDLRDTTTAQGHLTHQLPSDCPQIAVMQEIYQQPSGKPGRNLAYTAYNTSWSANHDTPVWATNNIVIRSDQPLVLFDVAVAVEWEPTADSSYLKELEQGLAQASTYLYDITDGQMAFGSWQITTGGHGWESADLRIRTANDYRPSAQVGGIVASATPYTAATGNSTVYAPGAIVLGRYWDGVTAADPNNGAWNQPAAYRTLVHEWLHYALFLYDEYQAVTADGRTETCNQVSAGLAASVMGYHYTASELWLDGTEAGCQASEQFHMHGGSDWETLARWGTIQGHAHTWLRKPIALNAGPTLGNLAGLKGQPPVAATDYRIFLPWLANRNAAGSALVSTVTPVQSASLQAASVMTVHVSINASLTLTDLLALQVQIYTWEPATATAPPRVIYQGTTTGPRQAPNLLGQATLVGIKPGTQVAVSILQPGGNPYVYYGELTPALRQQTLSATLAPTTLNLAVAPLFDGTRIYAYNLTLRSSVPLTLHARCSNQLCPNQWLARNHDR
jgi:hypothetical protein